MRVVAAVVLCVLALSGSVPRTRTTAEALPHDAYIWQRIWTPRVMAAAQRSSDIVRSWRVLVAESDSAGRWTSIAVPWPEIGAIGRPVVGVVRIDGRLDEKRMPSLLDRIQAATEAAGPMLAGLEIDYDCPTSKLPGYARFLSELRTRLPRSMSLSITALPTWMNSTAVEQLTRDLDEIVLQVHAVDDPRRGLFDPDQAERWVRAFARRTRVPFRVALPAYDVRVTWRPDGRLASVEGEMALLSGAREGAVLRASPEQVLQFLRTLDRVAPDNLAGIVWFRLPTDADSRAWSLSTWRAVISRALPRTAVTAVLEPTERAEVWSVTLTNDGPVDAVVPRQVRLDPGCETADGANGFRLTAASLEGRQSLVLETVQSDRLRAHRKRTIGWARCAQLHQGKLDVVQ